MAATGALIFILSINTYYTVEDEVHFILHCPKYNTERQNLLEIYLSNLVGDNVAKLNALMQQAVRPLAKYIHKAFQKRREALYVS